jgi:general secretion pathway protein H
MRILAAGSDVASTLFTSCNALPPEGAGLAWGGPALRPVATTLAIACGLLPPEGAAAPASWRSRFRGPGLTGRPAPTQGSRGSLHPGPARPGGFTLLELLVVIAIVAVATAGVSLAMRDNSQTALEREAQRLAVLFESARAQSRASGSAVIWRSTADGFKFEGVMPGALPTRWLEAGTRVDPRAAIQLGPEPVIGAQSVDIFLDDPANGQPARVLRIATDGLRPFALQATEPP